MFEYVFDMLSDVQPRFLMGLFGSTVEEVKTLASMFNARGTRPFLQPWRYNTRLHFYPNYIIPLGPGGPCKYAEFAAAPAIESYISELDEPRQKALLDSLKRWFNVPRFGRS